MAVVVAPVQAVGRWRRGRQRRVELGFPPVWLAAGKVVFMTALVTALLTALPLLAIHLATTGLD